MIFRGKHDFSKFFCLRDFRIFYRQKSVGPIGPTPQGRGLRKGELKSSPHPPKKSTTDKRKNAYFKLRGVAAEGRGDVDVDVDE
jgi:hypothetical protein